MKSLTDKKLWLALVFVVGWQFAVSGFASPIDLALNPSRSGFPDPTASNHGWGAGSDVWSIVDGKRAYSSWANGLAFTGGVSGWGGEAGGVRQATVNFGILTAFDEVLLWWHGTSETPLQTQLSVWNDQLGQWAPIQAQRTYAEFEADVPNSISGYSHSDRYVFDMVVGSLVKVAFDNTGLAITGGQMVHGWLYEFEVFNNQSTPGALPLPGSVSLMLLGLALMPMFTRRRFAKLPVRQD